MKATRLILMPMLLAVALLQAPSAGADEVAEVAGRGAGDIGAEALQGRVDAVLAEFGGTQTGPNEVSWDGGSVTLELAPDPGATLREASPAVARISAAIGGCTAGAHCIYSGSNYTGDKVTFSGCSTTESVALLDGYVRSVVNATAADMVKVFAGTTVLARVAAGAGKNVAGAATRISCS